MTQKKPTVRDDRAFMQRIAKKEAEAAQKRAAASKGAKRK